MFDHDKGQSVVNNEQKLNSLADNMVSGMPDPQRSPGKELVIDVLKNNPGIAVNAASQYA